MDDKSEELQRYDARARQTLQSTKLMETVQFGVAAVSPIHRAPFAFYERCMRELVLPSHRVLELGAGSGVHTYVLLQTGARVTATDLSPNALALLERNLAAIGKGRLVTEVADIEALPFESGSFDVVACAGSLSYGDARLVDREVQRVLRPGGTFICVDSFNHNPIYRLNRWMQYLRGKRSRSTLLRMPNAARIDALRGHFDSVEVRYFGGLTWAMPLLARVLGSARAAALSDAFDQLLNVRFSAFKFVLVARGRRSVPL